jgi:arsenate reductase
MSITIYHNPRCSKSRLTLELLREKAIEPRIMLYLDTPPDTSTLTSILKKLALPARELLRKGEEVYKTLQLSNPALDEEALIAAMCAHPQLIERPIVINGNKAAVGRPPENVLSIL